MMQSRLSVSALNKAIEFLLINAHTIQDISLHQGKAGISLTLFELAQKLSNASLQDHAFDLLQEVLVYDTKNSSKIGIAYTLQYLINNNLLEADFFDLYEEPHMSIIEEIKGIKYSNNFQNLSTYLAYIHYSKQYLNKVDFAVCEQILIRELNAYLSSAKLESITDIRVHQNNVSRLLSLFNSIQITSNAFTSSIVELENRRLELDCIYDDILYCLNLYIYGSSKHNKLSKIGEKSINNVMRNLDTNILSFKQKIDISYILYYIFKLNNSIDYRKNADIIMGTIIDDNLDSFEKKLNTTLTSIGLGDGFCRLLLVEIYWQKIKEGIFPKNLTELLTW